MVSRTLAQGSEFATSLSLLLVKSFGLFVRAGVLRSSFYLVILSFTYTKSGKWPAYPPFPIGLISSWYCFLGWGATRIALPTSPRQTWAVLGFKCALLSLHEEPLKRGQGAQCTVSICSTSCANLVTHSLTFISHLFPSPKNALSRQFKLTESDPNSCTASKSCLWLPANCRLEIQPLHISFVLWLWLKFCKLWTLLPCYFLA